MKEATLERLHEIGLVAVIRGPSEDLTLKMVDALVAGGVQGIEITYTTPNAPQVARAIDQAFGEQILLGMGTLTETAQAQEAHDAGARYLVSPICDPELGRAMVATYLPVMIGAMTPSEVYQAHRLGSDVVKIFPGSTVWPCLYQSSQRSLPLH